MAESRLRRLDDGRYEYSPKKGTPLPTSVLLTFLTEGFLLGFLATAGGAILGVALSVFLNSAHVPLPVGVQFVLLSDKLVVLPTAQWVFIAAQLKPVSAMKHAG